MKKFIASILTLSIGLSTAIPVLAGTPISESTAFNIDNYTQYTIDFNESKRVTRSTPVDTIEAAKDYVETLNLDDIGYSYLEEACMMELDSYKNDGITLESYTVLVPKTRAKTYYGTYLNYDYYYEYTSVSDMRRETAGEEKDSSNATQWSNWILGLMDLAMCFSTWEWSVPYSIVRNITGVSGTSAVHNGSYNEYVEQFTDTVTRTIYKEKSGGVMDPCYQDQESSLRVKYYFCPVGTAFDSDYIEIGTIFEDDVTANDLTKNEILRQANTYSNHGGEVIYRVSHHRVTEDWG